ncbi:MAG: bifunctional oligoribonuclease/PAP phosphatase NrnA [Candidatus Saganbacteria bacterium]|nr:bifunctional oligoribonuclease/PAP phosphatase NrnA [Candidatus Saganbacteria bacterium]
MKKSCGEIKNALKNAKTALIATHVDPDGDAIGSALALGMVLEQLGIRTAYYCQDSVPQIYRFLPGADKIKREVKDFNRFDVACVVDASDLARVGGRLDLKQCAPLIINLDHHPDNTLFGDVNCVKQSSCVGELIYDLAVLFKIKVDKKMADCLYTSIITDTGNFRYDNTTVKTFLIAAELLKAGVDPHELTTRIYDNKSVPAVRIAARALSGVKFSGDRQVGWSVVTEGMMEEVGAKSEDVVGIVDAIRAIEGVEVAVFFREEKGKVKINFRSKDRVNVSELARRFGGGGHLKAAGAVVSGEIAEVELNVTRDIIKHLKALKFLV